MKHRRELSKYTVLHAPLILRNAYSTAECLDWSLEKAAVFLAAETSDQVKAAESARADV